MFIHVHVCEAILLLCTYAMCLLWHCKETELPWVRFKPQVINKHAYHSWKVSILVFDSAADLQHATETSLELLAITDGIVTQHQVHN